MRKQFLIGLALAAGLSLSGCQQINETINGNKPANANTASNSNSASNTNANVNATTKPASDPDQPAAAAETNGAVFTVNHNAKKCEPEPGWTTCVEMASPSIKIFTSRLASASAINGVVNTYTEMTKRLSEKYPKDKFNGYKVYLTNGEPWQELSKISPVGTLWPDQTGKMSGDYLRGGTTKDYLWIDEQMMCKTGVRTRNEAGMPDNDKRALDQVVHEFAHAIAYRFDLDKTVNENFSSNPGFPATEQFPWSIQYWFGTPAGRMVPKEEAVIKEIFSSRVSLTCEGYKP